MLATILTIAFSSLAHAETTVGGRLFADQYVATHSSDPRNRQTSLSAWLDVDSHNEEGVGFRAVGETNVLFKSIAYPEREKVLGRLREGYTSYLSPGLDLRIGQQIIPWGKSDVINPTDYFTAKDLTMLNPDEEVKRRGAPSINLSYTPDAGNSPITLNTIIQTTFVPMRLLIPNRAVPSGITLQRYREDLSPFDVDTFQYGTKLSYQQPSYDFSVSAFRGFNQYPQYMLNPTTFAVTPFNPRETAVGADASFTAGDSVVRLESAVHFHDNGSADDPMAGLVEPHHWDSVLGIERPLWNDFRIQVQALMRYHLNFTDTPTNPNPVVNQIQNAISEANRLILNFQRRANPGATLRFSYLSDQSKWGGEIFLMGYFAQGQDYLIRPVINYAPVENVKLQTGWDYYGGNPNRPLGALHDQSAWFFEAKHVF